MRFGDCLVDYYFIMQIVPAYQPKAINIEWSIIIIDGQSYDP